MININCILKQWQSNENNQPLLKCIYILGNLFNQQLGKQHASFPVGFFPSETTQCYMFRYPTDGVTDVQLLLAATTCQLTHRGYKIEISVSVSFPLVHKSMFFMLLSHFLLEMNRHHLFLSFCRCFKTTVRWLSSCEDEFTADLHGFNKVTIETVLL